MAPPSASIRELCSHRDFSPVLGFVNTADSRARDSQLIQRQSTISPKSTVRLTNIGSPRKIAAMHAPVVTTGRDLRLDLFRGIALWLIFLDHIPSNLVAWLTIRNYGF